MIIEELTAKSFRAHAETTLSFAPTVNALCGPNGVGKTNILEAIHYVCLSKSFVGGTDSFALRKGDPFFEITGRFEFQTRASSTVRLVYVPREGKRLFVNGAALDRMSEIVGRFPIVILSPNDYVLTAGGPEERRRLLDNILSQAHPVYLAELMTYRRALKQRNALLRGARGGPQSMRSLAPWTDKLVEIGSRLIARRASFVTTFSSYLDDAHRTIASVAERPTITYRTIAEFDDEPGAAEIQAIFRERLTRVTDREVEQGRSLIGPHRDELVFKLDGLEVRRYASQGQHRTFAMALKLAQYFYISDTSNEHPLFLLDDVLDNLDPQRREAILQLLQSDQIGQSIITASDDRLFDGTVDFSTDNNRLIRIQQETPVTSG